MIKLRLAPPQNLNYYISFNDYTLKINSKEVFVTNYDNDRN